TACTLLNSTAGQFVPLSLLTSTARGGGGFAPPMHGSAPVSAALHRMMQGNIGCLPGFTAPLIQAPLA
ncbi:MAG: hypothetical protein ACKPKO_51880, partial [Candidatus Fonsibacter sp.]